MWTNSPASRTQPYPLSHRQSYMSDTPSVSSYHSVTTGTMTNNSQYNPHYHHVVSPAPTPAPAPTPQQYFSYQQPQQQTQPPNSHPPSLTTILLANSPSHFQSATQHPFLRLAGLGQLPKPLLSRWLSQDRLYAQAYISFIGSLISRVDLPYVFIHDKSSSLRWRIVNMLTSALTNIHREIDFFTTTAQQYGLNLEAPLRPGDTKFTADTATKQYIDLFRAFWTDPSMSLLEGLVVLWATETVYLRAWSYAASFMNAPYNTETFSRPPPPPLSSSSRTNSHYSYPYSHNHNHTASNSHSNYAPSNPDSEGPIPLLSSFDAPAHQPQTQTQTPSTPTLIAQHFTPAPTNSTNPSTNNNNGNGTGTSTSTTDLDGGALRHAFIPNWTSREFETFVREIADITDELADREDAVGRKLDVYKAVWRHILDVESRFWPNVE